MFFFTYTAAILSILFIGFAVFLFVKKRKNPQAIFLCLFLVTGAIWMGSNSGADLATTDTSLIFWSGLALIGAMFSSSLYLCFVESFIIEQTPPWKHLFLYTAPSIIFSVFAFSSYAIKETLFPPELPAQIIPGMLYLIPGTLYFIGPLFSVGILVWFFKKSTGKRRQQIIYITLGFLILFIGSFTFGVLLPAFGELRFYNVAPQFSIFFIGLLSYAVLKHQLLDIRLVIQRGVVYSVLASVVIGFYLVVVFILGTVFQTSLQINTLIGAGTTAFFGIFTTPILERYLRKMTDHIFFKDRYDYEEALETLSNILNTHLDKLTLISKTTETLSSILRVKQIQIIQASELNEIAQQIQKCIHGSLRDHFGNHVILKNEIEGHMMSAAKNETDVSKLTTLYKNMFETYDAEVAIPIHSATNRIGTIFIGAKRSGDPFIPIDTMLLRTFAHQAAVALEKATLYQQVKEYSGELETRVEERTTELQQLQEKQKRSMLTISHGLQTPLTIIKGELHFLQKKLADETLSVFENSIDDVSRYIKNLLKLAKLEATTDSTSTYEPMNMSLLANDICESFSANTEQNKRITFTRNADSDIWINALPDEIIEILNNLLWNAEKYSDDNRHNAISLSLKTDQKRIILSVTDTGIGISPEHIDHVFEGFYREKENSTKKGTGLGLAIVKHLVEKYNGTIKVTSNVGKDTTFTVEFIQ